MGPEEYGNAHDLSSISLRKNIFGIIMLFFLLIIFIVGALFLLSELRSRQSSSSTNNSITNQVTPIPTMNDVPSSLNGSSSSLSLTNDIPVYPNAKSIDSNNSDYSYSYETKDSISQVMEYYRSQLKTNNWQITEDKFETINAVKGNKNLNLEFLSQNNKSFIFIDLNNK